MVTILQKDFLPSLVVFSAQITKERARNIMKESWKANPSITNLGNLMDKIVCHFYGVGV